MSEQKPRVISHQSECNGVITIEDYVQKSYYDALASQLDAALKDNAILETQYNSQIIVTGELVKNLREIAEK